MRERFRRLDARLRLNRLAIGGAAAQVLFAATDVGLFDVLAKQGECTADEVAASLRTHPDATRRLLGALVALDLVEHVDGRFRNAMAAQDFLVRRGEESMATWVSLLGDWTSTLGRLDEGLRTAAPVVDLTAHLGGSEEVTRTFILGMHDYALGPGRELARHLDLDGRRRLLDVGGGPGTYSVLLAETNPELQCTVLDLAGVLEIARSVIEDRGLTARIDTAEGDYRAGPYPGGFDVALVSNVLHQEPWETCVAMLRHSHQALTSGGLVVVHGMFLNEQEDGPLWPAVHSLILMLMYDGGRAYTVQQTFVMLGEAGFRDAELHEMSPFNAGAFVTATRP